ncbi:MAG: polymer-forming cytoskeletal protein [candidate division Zixibacteria bacterium]|nr:polymer-forming cytoskeletal protein [candidate division Zixibacteria bacterium]
MKVLLTTIFALLLSTSLLLGDQSDDTDYQGKVFREISIDENGIFLTDTAGNVIEVPVKGEAAVSGSDDYVVTDDPERYGLFTDCDRVLNMITKIGGSVTLEDDECVAGDIVVVGGDATIKGRVRGTITVTGEVRITSSAVVTGDITGRKVVVEPGADVWGDIKETDITGWKAPIVLEDRSSTTLILLVILLTLLGVVLLVTVVFPKATNRVREVYRLNLFRALLVGFLAEILLLPALVLLIITIIGIPVALIGLPLAVVGAGLLGLAAFSLFIGDLVRTRDEEATNSRPMRTMTGFAILHSPIIGQCFFDMVGADLPSIGLGIIGAFLVLVVFTSSLGAALLTRFGTREYNANGDTATVTVQVK